MANRKYLKNIKTTKDLVAYQPSSQGFKELLTEMIRLDIPILGVGSSSIGKSYFIRELQARCGVDGEFLFVGTEKSEFIEGIPNLKSAVETGSQKFSYLKPYWFPDQDEIRKRLISGRTQLKTLPTKELTDLYAQSKTSYDALVTLKAELLKIRRDETTTKKAKAAGQNISKYVFADALSYISMLQGFGNFWLILDEIDKVEKQDKDKYAPLLHIVRERELKGWKLSGIRDYPEYDIKFSQTIDDRYTRLDKALDDPSVDITDTRIIAIANDLQVMEEESPALYRRFVKVIIDRYLYDPNQFSAETASMNEASRQKLLETDPALAYQTKRNEFHSCIAVKEVPTKGKMVQDLMAEIETEKTGNPLDELNLQWTLGFLPDMLFPGVDTSKQTAGRELFIPNLFVRDWNETENPFETYLYKIINDNFNVNYWVLLLECIDNLISYQKLVDTTAGTLQEKALQMLRQGGLVPENYNNPPEQAVDGVLNIYNALLLDIEDGLKNLGAEAQKELIEGGFKATGEMTGISGSILITAQENIQLGGYLIEASLIESAQGKTTKSVLTDKLLSAIPFIQNRLISCSPYISYTYANDMTNYMNDTAIKIVAKTSGTKTVKQKDLEEMAKNLFNDTAVDKDLLLNYGCGLGLADAAAIKEFKLGGDKEAKDELLKKIFDRRPVIVYDAFLTKLTEDQKIKYYQSLAPYRMIEKEVFSDLPKSVGMLVKSAKSSEGYNAEMAKDIPYYCDNFPYNMKALSEAPTVKEIGWLYDMINISCDKNIAAGIGSEIDRVNKFD